MVIFSIINFIVSKCSIQANVAKGTRNASDANAVPSDKSTTKSNMHLLGTSYFFILNE